MEREDLDPSEKRDAGIEKMDRHRDGVKAGRRWANSSYAGAHPSLNRKIETPKWTLKDFLRRKKVSSAVLSASSKSNANSDGSSESDSELEDPPIMAPNTNFIMSSGSPETLASPTARQIQASTHPSVRLGINQSRSPAPVRPAPNQRLPNLEVLTLDSWKPISLPCIRVPYGGAKLDQSTGEEFYEVKRVLDAQGSPVIAFVAGASPLSRAGERVPNMAVIKLAAFAEVSHMKATRWTMCIR